MRGGIKFPTLAIDNTAQASRYLRDVPLGVVEIPPPIQHIRRGPKMNVQLQTAEKIAEVTTTDDQSQVSMAAIRALPLDELESVGGGTMIYQY